MAFWKKDHTAAIWEARARSLSVGESSALADDGLPNGGNTSPGGSHFVQGKNTAARFGESDSGWVETEVDTDDQARRFLRSLLMSDKFEMAIGVVIIINGGLIGWETQIHAQEDEELPGWFAAMDFVFLIIFSLESLARLYVWRMLFFRNSWNLGDAAIVIMGWVSMAVSTMPSVTLLRMIRICRLARIGRILITFRELYTLIQGLVPCVRTLVWATSLIFLWTFVCALFVMETMRGYTEDSSEMDPDECTPSCPLLFKGVRPTFMILFQILTLDGWSGALRPLMVAKPLTVGFFITYIFISVFGLLNLVTAVIVQTAVEARETDWANRSVIKQKEQEDVRKRLGKLCKQLDEDDSATISRDEMERHVQTNDEFRSILMTMDVQDADMQDLWHLLDNKGDGEVPLDEFVETLCQMKSTECRYTLLMISYHVRATKSLIIDTLEALEGSLEGLASNLSEQPQQPAAQTSDAEGGDASEQALSNLLDKLDGQILKLQYNCDMGGEISKMRDELNFLERNLDENPRSGQARVPVAAA